MLKLRRLPYAARRAPSVSATIMRAKVRFSSESSSAGSWYRSNPISRVFSAARVARFGLRALDATSSLSEVGRCPASGGRVPRMSWDRPSVNRQFLVSMDTPLQFGWPDKAVSAGKAVAPLRYEREQVRAWIWSSIAMINGRSGMFVTTMSPL